MQVTTLLGKVGEMEKARATSAEVDAKQQEVDIQREAVDSLKQVAQTTNFYRDYCDNCILLTARATPGIGHANANL